MFTRSPKQDADIYRNHEAMLLKYKTGRNVVENGVSRLGLLFFVLVIVSVVYSGSQIIPFYYDYYEIKGLMEGQADKASVHTDHQIRVAIRKKIVKLGIPIDIEDLDDHLEIARLSGKIVIDLKYQEVFYVTLWDDTDKEIYVFDFNPHVERNLK